MIYRALMAGTVLAVLVFSASLTVVPVAGQAPSDAVTSSDAVTAEWPPPPTTYSPAPDAMGRSGPAGYLGLSEPDPDGTTGSV